MRFQKVLIFFFVVSLSLSLAFSQTALSVHKTSSRANETPHQMRLEVQANAADLRAKEAEFAAAAARISLGELQHSGEKKDRKAYSARMLNLKAKIALAESAAAEARAEAIRSRVAALKDKASTAAKLASQPSKDKKAQAKYYDALWLQQLAAKSEKDVAKADNEAARKDKIAQEAARKVSRENTSYASNRSKVYEVPIVAVSDKIAKQNRELRSASNSTKEPVRLARIEQDVARKEEEIHRVSSESDTANNELLELLHNQQSQLDAKEGKQAELIAKRNIAPTQVAQVARENSQPENFFREKAVVTTSESIKVAQLSVNESESSIQNVENTTTIISASNAGGDLVGILRRKQAEMDAAEAIDKKSESIVVAPKLAKPVMEVKKVRRPQPKANVAKAAVVVSQPAVAPETQDRLVEILRSKQTELDAQQRHTSKQEIVPVASRSVLVAEPKVRAQELHATPPEVNVPQASAVVSQPALTPQDQDQLVEILRKKQAELDAKAGVAVEAARPFAPSMSEQGRNERIRQIEAEIKAKEDTLKKANTAKLKAPTKKEEAMKAALNAMTPAQPQNVPAPDLHPGSKEARLDELLRKYKADEITPHEYHFERAKIIAEP